MRRLSRPQSSDSPLEPSLQWRLIPLLQADPGQTVRTSPDSATPSVLYRSSFAQECEAVVFRLSNVAEGMRPQCPLTIEEETLTPLEPPCSFLDSFDSHFPPRPVPEPASASAGPPDPLGAVPCGEQSTGLAGVSLGGGAQLAAAATSPDSGLAGVSPWPDVTYECTGSGSSANATYICTRSPSSGEKGTPADAPSAQPALEVCKRKLPFVTSTPLMAPSLSKEASPAALCTECPRKRAAIGSDSKQKPPADLRRDFGFGVTFASNPRSVPGAAAGASSGADRMPHVSGKAPFAKKSLSLRASRPLRTRGALGIGGLPKGTGTTRKMTQPAVGNCSQNIAIPPTRSGSADLQSQPVTQLLFGQLSLSALPLALSGCEKNVPVEKGKKITRGIEPAKATRLSSNKVTAKTSSQKRPWDKPSDKATASPLNQPFPKRSCLYKNQKEKPTCNDMMAVGQTPSATLEKELTAPCSQCQWLAEENQQLKSMLETCQKTIAFLEKKSPGWALEDVQWMELKPS
ncbi:UNVERIFIED_CONTAM: hypothetical protein K2H54_032544 [Gekko kuhli]